MRGVTHLVAGLVLAAIITEFFTFQKPLLAIILILVGSLIPDIDEKTSILGRKFRIIGSVSKHRTFFHGILFLVVCVAALSLIVELKYVLAFTAGFTSHILLDALTPAGVRPFWPSPLKIKGFIRVGSVLEKILFLLLVGIFVWLLVA